MHAFELAVDDVDAGCKPGVNETNRQTEQGELLGTVVVFWYSYHNDANKAKYHADTLNQRNFLCVYPKAKDRCPKRSCLSNNHVQHNRHQANWVHHSSEISEPDNRSLVKPVHTSFSSNVAKRIYFVLVKHSNRKKQISAKLPKHEFFYCHTLFVDYFEDNRDNRVRKTEKIHVKNSFWPVVGKLLLNSY